MPAGDAPVPEDEPLHTSEDLFGEFVDTPSQPGPVAAALRSEPIRVRVADPGAPEAMPAAARTDRPPAAEIEALLATLPIPAAPAASSAAVLETLKRAPEPGLAEASPVPEATPVPAPAPDPFPTDTIAAMFVPTEEPSAAPGGSAIMDATPGLPPADDVPPFADSGLAPDVAALLDVFDESRAPGTAALVPAGAPISGAPLESLPVRTSSPQAPASPPATFPRAASAIDDPQLAELAASMAFAEAAAHEPAEMSFEALPDTPPDLSHPVAAQIWGAPVRQDSDAADAVDVAAQLQAARFQAAAPKALFSAPTLDLAALAESAMTAVPPPRASEVVAGAAGQLDTGPYGPYRLLEKLAVGGMAEVFRASRAGVAGFEKVVAVKRILPHLSDNREFVDMFIDEAKMVAGLAHPNIVQIFDLGRIDKSYYIAMEFVDGHDLRTILSRARERKLRIPLDLSAMIVSRVCAALAYAHRKKDDRGRPMMIVHRDISPQNILISFEGEVKLTDFGIAKARSKATTTDRGALRGKLLYMSPEQASGGPIDRRSDLFALGIVLYEMVTDRKPFTGNSELGILATIRECAVAAPSTLVPEIPEGLEAVILRALSRDAATRYQDAAEMGRELERVLRERQPPGAHELARLMEVLFDREERGELHAPEEEPAEALEELEADFEGALDVDGELAQQAAASKPGVVGRFLNKIGFK